MEKLLTISKLDAAKSQLETVIRMYFNSGDPVSMHTLAAAGYNVIRDINEKRGGKPMVVKDQIFEHVKPEHHKLLREKMNEAENFFKHADRDHDASLDFNPDSTEFLILDACDKYAELTGELPPMFQIYRSWIMITHQEIFTLPEDQLRILKDATRTFTAAGRASYFNKMLPLVMKNGV